VNRSSTDSVGSASNHSHCPHRLATDGEEVVRAEVVVASTHANAAPCGLSWGEVASGAGSGAAASAIGSGSARRSTLPFGVVGRAR
jgi:hypothetical protein